jgi:hypothetical protein
VKKDRYWLVEHRKRVACLRFRNCEVSRLAKFVRNRHVVQMRDEFIARQAGLPAPQQSDGYFEVPSIKLKARKLLAPRTFCLDRNYAEFLGYIYAIRWEFFKKRLGNVRRKKIWVVDLKDVRQMSLDAALVLVAEYNRFILYSQNANVHIDDKDWPSDIVAAFEELGFYQLIGARSRSRLQVSANVASDRKWVRFRSEEDSEGKRADELVRDLEGIAGSAPDRFLVYEALVEAINNCKGHAYPDQPMKLEPVERRWWSAGAFDVSDNTLNIVVYDQGVGIPKTLRKRPFIEAILKLCPPEQTDADVIAGAVEFGRSSVEASERGNGLARMFELVKELPKSYMRIVSGRGKVTFKASGKINREILSNPFTGTLICWSLKLPKLAAGASQ